MKRIQKFSILLIVMLVSLAFSSNKGYAAINKEGYTKSSSTISKTISKGKSYQFSNVSKKTGQVKITGTSKARYDFVVYDKYGEVYSSLLHDWGYSYITVPSGGKVIITNQGKESIKAGGPKSLFKGKASSSAAFTRSTVSKGKTYQFSNRSKIDAPVRIKGSDKTRYDYVVYNQYGEADQYKTKLNESYSSMVTVPAGGKIVITNIANEPIIAGGPKALFTGKKSSSAALTRATISKGNTFVLTNTSKIEGPVKINGSSKTRYDYVVYDQYGEVDQYKTKLNESYSSMVTVPAGGKIVITSIANEPIIAGGPKALFTGKKSSSTALTRAMISKGKTYVLTNTSKIEGPVKINGSDKTRYDYVVYDQYGEVDQYKNRLHVSYSSTVTVPAGGKIVITSIANEPIIVGGPKALFTSKASSSAAFTRYTIEKGKSYELSNISKMDIDVKIVVSSKGKYDYVVYYQSGDVKKFEIDNGWTSTFTVPAGGKIVITGKGNEPIIAGGPKLFFTGKAK
ncbi:hypothetical protein RCG24_11235 [Neobacillus sp. OS1-32]|uniref:hypothetical protein n=1 Tax=Neobacillus sp. OS1-32 TaxID=3070682 RepID=UPI0027E09D8E|nr:hypothetical protein [Neobacillus sp. OS1-32]WML28623.1 hypothetical protein RCG24_11235 [Neobacillus sp. OS1-32]